MWKWITGGVIALGVVWLYWRRILEVGNIHDEIGLFNEIVGGLVVGLVLVVYELVQRGRRESEKEESTYRMIRKALESAGEALGEAVANLPDDNGTGREFVICRQKLAAYKDEVEKLKQYMDTDRLDSGLTGTDQLVSHFLLMDSIDPNKWIRTVNQQGATSARGKLREAAEDVVRHHQALMKAVN